MLFQMEKKYIYIEHDLLEKLPLVTEMCRGHSKLCNVFIAYKSLDITLIKDIYPLKLYSKLMTLHPDNQPNL